MAGCKRIMHQSIPIITIPPSPPRDQSLWDYKFPTPRPWEADKFPTPSTVGEQQKLTWTCSSIYSIQRLIYRMANWTKPFFLLCYSLKHAVAYPLPTNSSYMALSGHHPIIPFSIGISSCPHPLNPQDKYCFEKAPPPHHRSKFAPGDLYNLL